MLFSKYCNILIRRSKLITFLQDSRLSGRGDPYRLTDLTDASDRTEYESVSTIIDSLKICSSILKSLYNLCISVTLFSQILMIRFLWKENIFSILWRHFGGLHSWASSVSNPHFKLLKWMTHFEWLTNLYDIK